MRNTNTSQRLVGEVQMFRIRVATAESKLKLLREQARQAKRRRKAAKRLAQRARRQFKRFKADLTELRQSLAKAEAKLFQAGGRALARKMARAKPVTKSRARPSSRPKAIARKLRPAPSAAARAPRRVLRKKPTPRPNSSVPQGHADEGVSETEQSIIQSTEVNPHIP